MSTTPAVNSNLPDYAFIAANGFFPGIPERAVVAEQNSVNILNNKGAGDFQYECNKWLSAATLARNAGEKIPDKPISPASWVVVSQDGVENGAAGKYIARAQVGPVYGVCPDLPLPDRDGHSTGKIFIGPTQTVTQDQKLDAIMATVLDISERLKKAGL